ncbi:MAG: arginine--tRNA ligase [Acidimicrobiales bacterium]
MTEPPPPRPAAPPPRRPAPEPSPAVAGLVFALRSALERLGLAEGAPAVVHLERPARPEHGDWSSNLAMVMAKAVGRPPRELASALAEQVRGEPPAHLAGVEVAGPGFLNFSLHPSWLHEALAQVVAGGAGGWASPDLGRGERVQIEFVSANPTGPLHVGNGWFAFYGDALARLMERCGYRVSREYYVNDTGGQVRALGLSVLHRRRGEPVPEGGYQGDYVAGLAGSYDGPDSAGPGAGPSPGDVAAAGRWAADRILGGIRQTLATVGISFDEWYSQASIEESGSVEETIAALAERGLVFEDGGATWLRTTALGDSRDRVLRRSAGEGGGYTYLAGDIAYHRDKFLVRGFDRVIDVWGANHSGQVPSLEAAMEALGVARGRLEVELGQMLSLKGGGVMSKRAGNFVTLDDLVADLGPGAARLLSLVSSIDRSVTLDLDLVRQQSPENPVYYVQYAHARIASIERVAAERGVERRPLAEVDLSLLTHERELDVVRGLTELPGVVAVACAERAPHKVTTWVRDLAGRFHSFYHDCYVMGEGVGPELTQARLWLVEGARVGLAVGLGVLGIDAPESM